MNVYMKAPQKSLLFCALAGTILMSIHSAQSQTFGSQIDSLLEQYYTEVSSDTFDLPVIESIFLTLTPEEIETKITDEAGILDILETQTDQTLNELRELQSSTKNGLQQLQLMDAELSVKTRKLDRLTAQIQKWEAERDILTRQNDAIRANLRMTQRESEQLKKTAYLKQKNWNNTPDTMMLQWLISDKSAGQILEQNRRMKGLLEQKSSQERILAQEKTAKETLEKKASLYVNQMQATKDQILRDKKALTELTQKKSQYLASTESTFSDYQNEIETLSDQYEETVENLEDLYAAQSQLEIAAEIEAEDIPFTSDEIIIPEPETENETPEIPEEIEIIETNPFVLPVDSPIQLSAGFNDAKFKTQFETDHTGLDFDVPQGTDIYAIADGTVAVAKGGTYNYSYVIIQHTDGFISVYGHLSKPLVKNGDTVTQGQKIALSGGTPGSIGAGYFTTGPHLHFELYQDGSLLDPETFLPL